MTRHDDVEELKAIVRAKIKEMNAQIFGFEDEAEVAHHDGFIDGLCWVVEQMHNLETADKMK